MGIQDNKQKLKMKRCLGILFLMTMILCANAQKKEISNARDNIKKNRNLEQAEKSMNDLLNDSANRQNERIWITLFDALVKQYEQGNEKLYLKQKYDTIKLFNLMKRMVQVAESLDSLDSSFLPYPSPYFQSYLLTCPS